MTLTSEQRFLQIQFDCAVYFGYTLKNYCKGEWSLKDFFQTTRFKVLLATCVVLAGIMAYAGANGRLQSAPQEFLTAALVPLQKVAALFSNGISGVVDEIVRLDIIADQNEQLQKENAELRQQLVELDQYKAENEMFRSANNLKEEHPEYTLLPGFVIGRDPLDQFYSFTLDVGTKHGVKKGNVVVSEHGYLVGMVLDATYTSAKVVTILNPALNVSGMISRTRDNGLVTGSDALVSEGLCLMNNLPRSTQASVGDEVITTGMGEVFPADLLVGRVVDIGTEASGQSMQAKVQPGEDISSIRQVLVLLDTGTAVSEPEPTPSPDTEE